MIYKTQRDEQSAIKNIFKSKLLPGPHSLEVLEFLYGHKKIIALAS